MMEDITLISLVPYFVLGSVLGAFAFLIEFLKKSKDRERANEERRKRKHSED